jgi:hypothetical protein
VNDLTTIHLHVDGDPFARVRKEALEDAALTWKAKGLLSYLLGKPDNWQVRQRDLVNRSADKKTAIQSGMRELETAGYAKREEVRQGGRFKALIWHISDRPIFKLLPQAGFPSTGNPSPEKPPTGNQPLSKNDDTKNDCTKLSPEKAAAEEDRKKRHTEFIDKWTKSHKAKFGREYIFNGGRDGKAVKEMLTISKMTPDQLVDLAWRAWRSFGREFFHCKKAVTIAYFASHLNEVMSELGVEHESPRDSIEDDHEAKHGVPRGAIPLSQRPYPGQDEHGNNIGTGEWEKRFPLTLYDHEK